MAIRDLAALISSLVVLAFAAFSVGFIDYTYGKGAANSACVLHGGEMQNYRWWGNHYECVVEYWEGGQRKTWVVREK